MHHQILEGTWSEVSKKAVDSKGDVHVRLEVIGPAGDGRMIQKGMFSGLRGLAADRA